ncbi:MAG: acyltransferase [Oscillospiraceae bacterium]|nr:acyltransferase [Oscillospiraceae bacterium]
MTFVKALRHIIAFIKIHLFKLIYGKKVHFGKNTTFRKDFSLMIGESASVKIGANCFFNNHCSINALQSIEIGDGSIFGEGVKIYDHNHRFRDSLNSIKQQGYSVAGVKIGSHCWLGSNVIILKGAEIGDNCVIGAGCVVSGQVPENSLVKLPYDNRIEKIGGNLT